MNKKRYPFYCKKEFNFKEYGGIYDIENLLPAKTFLNELIFIKSLAHIDAEPDFFFENCSL